MQRREGRARGRDLSIDLPKPVRAAPDEAVNERERWDVNQRSPTFAADIRALFRDSDVDEMSWSFDLASYDDVRDNAEAIYERLSDGSMPCDEPWPDERVATFRAWIDAGTPA